MLSKMCSILVYVLAGMHLLATAMPQKHRLIKTVSCVQAQITQTRDWIRLKLSFYEYYRACVMLRMERESSYEMRHVGSPSIICKNTAEWNWSLMAQGTHYLWQKNTVSDCDVCFWLNLFGSNTGTFSFYLWTLNLMLKIWTIAKTLLLNLIHVQGTRIKDVNTWRWNGILPNWE